VNTNKALLNWYQSNKRDLPWRSNRNPYNIWISEVILQQTRVVQGTPYFHSFLKNFPTIQALAEAEENEVLNVWKGLGYYSRARNLQFAAQQIMKDFNGEFPTTHKELLKLKGVGPYTAAAIGSIAFNLPVAAVDGNVIRVLSRLFNYTSIVNSTIGMKDISALANEFLNEQSPGDHNQAIMELGALVCLPTPKCDGCPLQPSCAAFAAKTQTTLPKKSPKKSIKIRYFVFKINVNNDCILLEKRTNEDIWKHLYHLPEIELFTREDFQIEQQNWMKKAKWNSGELKHILTHQHIVSETFFIEDMNASDKGEWIPLRSLDDVPTPKLFQTIMDLYLGA